MLKNIIIKQFKEFRFETNAVYWFKRYLEKYGPEEYIGKRSFRPHWIREQESRGDRIS